MYEQSSSGILAVLGGFFFVIIAIAIFCIVCMWKVYSKAGQPGWAAIIPIYNLIVLLQIVQRPIWWIILMIIPCVNIVVLFIVYIDLAKVFGKGTGFGLGLIFLPFIFVPMLAFGDAEYQRTSVPNAF